MPPIEHLQEPPRVFRFSPVLRIAIHAVGLALLFGPLYLPNEASTRDEALYAIWGVWGCAVFCFATAEFLAAQRFEVFGGHVVCSSFGGSVSIEFRDLAGVHVSGTGIHLRTKSGRVRSFSRGFSRESEMLSLVKQRCIVLGSSV